MCYGSRYFKYKGCDCIPKNQSGSDRVVESPTAVDEKVLNEYFITTKVL